MNLCNQGIREILGHFREFAKSLNGLGQNAKEVHKTPERLAWDVISFFNMFSLLEE